VGVELSRFVSLSRLVATASGKQVAWHKSLVGDGAFTHEAGIHVDGLLKDPRNYQGFDNLYHILNHLSLFGTAYLAQAQGMMERLLARVR
jgi:isopropylmalate/homocitrate/citramalate synthase